MALVLGTNCGFVSEAPVADPEGAANYATDGIADALEDTTPATAVKVTEIGWWCDSQGDDGPNWEVGIYDDDNDEPGDLLAGADIVNVLTAGAGWKSVVGLNITITPEIKYWIAMQLDAELVSVTRNASGSGEGDWHYDTLDALPATWLNATDAETTRNTAIYAVWEAAVAGAAGIMTPNTGFWGPTF